MRPDNLIPQQTQVQNSSPLVFGSPWQFECIFDSRIG